IPAPPPGSGTRSSGWRSSPTSRSPTSAPGGGTPSLGRAAGGGGGLRRRPAFLWQDWWVEAMIEGLGDRFLGTSNCLIAMRRDLEAIGTNAHELPMVYAWLAEYDAALATAPYRVLENWHEDYDGNLRIILPDTYGTKGFL